MRGLLWLVRKDLMIFFADWQGALMTVLVPVVLASFLGMLFAPRASSTVLDLLVVTEETTPEVRAFVAAIAASENFEVEETDAATARARVGQGKASLALFLPVGSTAALRPSAMFQGKQEKAELLHDPSDEIEASMATGLLTQVLMQQTMGSLSNRGTMGTMFEDLQAGLSDDADPAMREFIRAGQVLGDSGEAGDSVGSDTAAEGDAGNGLRPSILFERKAAAPSGPTAGYNSYAHNFAGMLLMFLLFAAQSRAKVLVAERENGSLLRLRLTPAGDRAILLGAGLSTTVIAVLASAVVYAVGIVIFKIEILGSLLGFLGVILAQALFVGGFSLLLSGLGRTEEQISSIGTFTVLVLSFAGGAMFPSFMMPGWLHQISVVLPTYWATRGLAAMTWRGFEVSAAVLPIAALLAAAAVCAFVGLRRFRFSS